MHYSTKNRWLFSSWYTSLRMRSVQILILVSPDENAAREYCGTNYTVLIHCAGAGLDAQSIYLFIWVYYIIL